jgi:hypothetical protein
VPALAAALVGQGHKSDLKICDFDQIVSAEKAISNFDDIVEFVAYLYQVNSVRLK